MRYIFTPQSKTTYQLDIECIIAPNHIIYKLLKVINFTVFYYRAFSACYLLHFIPISNKIWTLKQMAKIPYREWRRIGISFYKESIRVLKIKLKPEGVKIRHYLLDSVFNKKFLLTCTYVYFSCMGKSIRLL